MTGLFKPVEPGLFTPVDGGESRPTSAQTHRSETAIVTTSETTAGTSYGDLATAGPSVTVGAGPSGKVLVIVTGQLTNNTANAVSYMSWEASGANSITPADDQAFYVWSAAANNGAHGSAAFVAEELDAGTTTFKASYKVNAGTGTFSNRRITAIPL